MISILLDGAVVFLAVLGFAAFLAAYSMEYHVVKNGLTFRQIRAFQKTLRFPFSALYGNKNVFIFGLEHVNSPEMHFSNLKNDECRIRRLMMVGLSLLGPITLGIAVSLEITRDGNIYHAMNYAFWSVLCILVISASLRFGHRAVGILLKQESDEDE